jgi:hypothetical protein
MVIFFYVCNKKITMRFASKNCNILVICSECELETSLKNIQQLIALNKGYLCRKCRNKGDRNGII